MFGAMHKPTAIGNQAYQKAVNVALIMRTIRAHPGISRTEIAADTGLTKSTVTNLVRNLLDQNLVEQIEARVDRPAGRPRVGLCLSHNNAAVVGVELRTTGVAMVSLGLDGAPRVQQKRFDRDASMHLTDAWRIAESMLTDLAPRGLLGVGVAVPATTDPYRGVVVESEDAMLRNFSLHQIAVGTAEHPVLLENDANAVAWGAVSEERRSGGGGRINVMAVTGRFFPDDGTLRIGTGIVVDDRVYYGSDFGAGEFRSAAWRRGMSGELVTQADAGGPRACLIEMLESLSVAASMLHPKRIIVAGDLVQYHGMITDVLMNELAGAFIDPEVSGAPIVPAPRAVYAVAAGAADMFLEHLFEIPSVERTRPMGMPRWQDLSPVA